MTAPILSKGKDYSDEEKARVISLFHYLHGSGMVPEDKMYLLISSKIYIEDEFYELADKQLKVIEYSIIRELNK